MQGKAYQYGLGILFLLLGGVLSHPQVQKLADDVILEALDEWIPRSSRPYDIRESPPYSPDVNVESDVSSGRTEFDGSGSAEADVGDNNWELSSIRFCESSELLLGDLKGEDCHGDYFCEGEKHVGVSVRITHPVYTHGREVSYVIRVLDEQNAHVATDEGIILIQEGTGMTDFNPREALQLARLLSGNTIEKRFQVQVWLNRTLRGTRELVVSKCETTNSTNARNNVNVYLDGDWLLQPLTERENENLLKASFTWRDGRITVSGQDWTGSGTFDGSKGEYKWSQNNVQYGVTKFVIDRNGWLHLVSTGRGGAVHKFLAYRVDGTCGARPTKSIDLRSSIQVQEEVGIAIYSEMRENNQSVTGDETSLVPVVKRYEQAEDCETARTGSFIITNATQHFARIVFANGPVGQIILSPRERYEMRNTIAGTYEIQKFVSYKKPFNWLSRKPDIISIVPCETGSLIIEE
ncbi:MAG TPA: hypothetical protein PLN54_05045 [Flavobacteriales bacterium]|nr:hypothetical protein [Flavobacteriales bacterium]